MIVKSMASIIRQLDHFLHWNIVGLIKLPICLPSIISLKLFLDNKYFFFYFILSGQMTLHLKCHIVHSFLQIPFSSPYYFFFLKLNESTVLMWWPQNWSPFSLVCFFFRMCWQLTWLTDFCPITCIICARVICMLEFIVILELNYLLER